MTKLSRNGVIAGTYAAENAPAGGVFVGRSIWISNSGSNTVTQLDYVSGNLIGSYPVGTSPAGMCFDDNAVWVTNKASSNVLRR